MSKCVKGSSYQGWRFLIYGVLLVVVLLSYSRDNRLSVSEVEDSNLALPIEVEIGLHEEIIEKSTSPKLDASRTKPMSLGYAKTSYQTINAIEPVGMSETVAEDSRNYGNLDTENDFIIEKEVKNLLIEREAIYSESRTLTVAEVAELHGVKDNEDFPFAVTNEAQLVLRELAIENRIPAECAEDISDQCLMILERSQAGSVPFECQEPHNRGECENAFSQFWEY